MRLRLRDVPTFRGFRLGFMEPRKYACVLFGLFAIPSIGVDALGGRTDQRFADYLDVICSRCSARGVTCDYCYDAESPTIKLLSRYALDHGQVRHFRRPTYPGFVRSTRTGRGCVAYDGICSARNHMDGGAAQRRPRSAALTRLIALRDGFGTDSHGFALLVGREPAPRNVSSIHRRAENGPYSRI